MARNQALVAHIGTRLREARLNAKLTQQQAAERIGATQVSLSLWETGRSAPSTPNAFALADAYRVSLDELLGYPVPDPPKGA
jgi:transcriptional regulator with XRE-family HTH domain